jgi:UDP-N-acetylmuramoyl-tripeptide--D-alanyl-D-alanine ligase
VTLAGGVVAIDDCYNANPMSMRAAIDELAASAPGRRVAVLGDMLELGEGALELHREIGRHAGERGVDALLSVGPLAAAIADAFPGESRSVGSAAEAAPVLAGMLRAGDTVLLKGSRGIGLERILEDLDELRAAPAGARAVAPETSGARSGRR